MMKKYSLVMLRVSLAFVFLYFGFQQIYDPDSWIGFVPEFLTGVILTANNLIMIGGILELSLGLFLLIGIYTRLSALILALHLFGITFAIGFNPLGVRDFGLAVATLFIFLNEPDWFTLDSRNSEEPLPEKKNRKKKKKTD